MTIFPIPRIKVVDIVIEQVLPHIYRVAVPLTGNPLRSINAYIIKGKERHLVIDTGMDTGECRQALLAAYDTLGVSPEQTDYFITHLHVDHFELVQKVAADTSMVFFNVADTLILDDDTRWDNAIIFAACNGFPETELRAFIDNMVESPIFAFKNNIKYTLLQDGDEIKAGDYTLTCLETPGHTPGSMCLYEAAENILFSGDHLLAEISPNISLLSERDFNPLKSYLESLDKIADLNAGLILPGHGDVFANSRHRIGELKIHHHQREEEILALLHREPGSAYGVAAQLRWDVSFNSWQEFPVFQRWFAVGETLAHLKYMESRGLVTSSKSEEKVFYSST